MGILRMGYLVNKISLENTRVDRKIAPDSASSCIRNSFLFAKSDRAYYFILIIVILVLPTKFITLNRANNILTQPNLLKS